MEPQLNVTTWVWSQYDNPYYLYGRCGLRLLWLYGRRYYRRSSVAYVESLEDICKSTNWRAHAWPVLADCRPSFSKLSGDLKGRNRKKLPLTILVSLLPGTVRTGLCLRSYHGRSQTCRLRVCTITSKLFISSNASITRVSSDLAGFLRAWLHEFQKPPTMTAGLSR